ncbi:DUF308 domain-containing protein [Sphaerisporangium sp. TRM90804]|uniref:HdeD family acid-resistance protein n=1 Tax=Sphaerisporangium sp. TRM90804 TaxID=3031113 RepID=UPI00244B48D2|nr:DUF308 domain-containing protein [Sphaerisporangium sp. TRM90804]MDH2429055.1 DUF308 domain-containing protein [Sphaerisporangium sp. TRM90804]
MHDLTEETAAHHWWIYALRGAAAVLFGVLALIWPAMTLLTLVVLFGAFAIVSGVFTLIGAFRGTHPRDARIWMVVSGVLGVVLGLVAWIWPGITTFALLMLIAAYAVVIGAVEIVAALLRRGGGEVLASFRRGEAGELDWMHLVNGVLAVIFGVLLFLWPATGALALTWLIGVFAVVYGISLLVLSVRVRGVGHRDTHGTAPHPA